MTKLVADEGVLLLDDHSKPKRFSGVGTKSSAVDLLKCVHDVEEAILFVSILLIDVTE